MVQSRNNWLVIAAALGLLVVAAVMVVVGKTRKTGAREEFAFKHSHAEMAELARQVEIQKVEIVPITNGEGERMKAWRVTWLNHGPKPIAALAVDVSVINFDTGEPTDDSITEWWVYGGTDSSVVQPGEVGSDDRENDRGVAILDSRLHPDRRYKVTVHPSLAE